MTKDQERYPNERPDGTRQCVWCGKAVEGRRIRWCSAACVVDYQLNHDWGEIRRFVRKRDCGVCAICGIDTVVEKTKWHELGLDRFRKRGLPQRTIGIAFSVLFITDRELQEIIQRHGWPKNADRDWWEADHIVSRHDGGVDHPDNLRTLCVPCHKAITALQARERKRERDVTKNQAPLLSGAVMPKP